MNALSGIPWWSPTVVHLNSRNQISPENISITSTVGGFTLVATLVVGDSALPAKPGFLDLNTRLNATTPLVSIQVPYDETLPPPAEEAAARASERASPGPWHQRPPTVHFEGPPQYRGGRSFERK